MSTILFIKDADFSANAITVLSEWKLIVSDSGSASKGTVTTGTSSTQMRYWIPLPQSTVVGKTYRVVLSVTNGSGTPSVSSYSDLCAVRLVADASARTGQDVIPTISTTSVEDVTTYEIDRQAVCDAVYPYLYVNINWDRAQPTKYPNFVIKFYEYRGE